jgi:hypothetical protein
MHRTSLALTLRDSENSRPTLLATLQASEEQNINDLEEDVHS